MAKIIHNDTVDVLLERVSIRAFKDEAIGLDVLNTIEQADQMMYQFKEKHKQAKRMAG